MKASDYFVIIAGMGFVLIAGYALIKAANKPPLVPQQPAPDATAQQIGAAAGLVDSIGSLVGY